MKMKADIEIVTGFIGAGKTSFINALIDETLVDKETIVVVQCEIGATQLKEDFKNDKRITIELNNPESSLTKEYLKNVLNAHRPHRVIIEANGTRPVNELLEVIYKKEIAKHCRLTTMFHITEAGTFQLFLNNMSNFLLPSIQLSNLILINNTASVDREELQQVKSKISNLNQNAQIIEVAHTDYLLSSVKEAKVLDNGIIKIFRTYIKNLI